MILATRQVSYVLPAKSYDQSNQTNTVRSYRPRLTTFATRCIHYDFQRPKNRSLDYGFTLLGKKLIIMVIIMIMILLLLTMMMMMMMIVIIVIIIIAFKGAIRDYYNLLTAPQTVSNTYAQVARRNRVQITCNACSAYHVQHVACHVAWRDSSAIKFDRL